MDRMLTSGLVARVLLTVGFLAAAAEPALATREWTVDGVVRQALVRVPAKATAEDEKLGLDMGCVDYLTKPIRVEALVQALLATRVEA